MALGAIQGFEISGDLDAARQEANASSREFPPLPAGIYQALIKEVKGVFPFAKSGNNASKKVLVLRVQIVKDSPNGASYAFTHRVPLFSRWAPSEKNPQGAANREFFWFWDDAVRFGSANLAAGKQPTEADLLGKQISIYLSEPKPANEWNPLGFNEVERTGAAESDFAATPLGSAEAPTTVASTPQVTQPQPAGNLWGGSADSGLTAAAASAQSF